MDENPYKSPETSGAAEPQTQTDVPRSDTSELLDAVACLATAVAIIFVATMIWTIVIPII